MDIGLVGLGKMGGNMRTRLRNAGHTVVGYDRNPDVSDVEGLEKMVERLSVMKNVLAGRLGHRDPITSTLHWFGARDREIALRSLER